MEQRQKKSVSNWLVFLLGVGLMIPFYVLDGAVLAVVNMGGMVFVLVAIVSGTVNFFKSSKKT